MDPPNIKQDQRPNLLKKGWAKKAPSLGRLNGFKNWKKRFFVLLQQNPNSNVFLKKIPKRGTDQMQALHSYYLVYWETEDTTKRPIRAIPLLGSYQVRMFPVYEKVIVIILIDPVLNTVCMWFKALLHAH